MYTSNLIGIIADDLTGADDTALQFHLRGCITQILLAPDAMPQAQAHTQAWAVCTNTRNASPDSAKETVKKTAEIAIEKLNIEHFYKKIDSTMRGNVAVETLELLDVLGWDAAIILPAFPGEGRTTIGGYQLLKGVPIERTELARDPHNPINESFIPLILKADLPEKEREIVGQIELTTVIKGAGPILLKIKELIEQGKKLIVVDASSTTDIEQVALAIEKSNYNILPCGSAGLARALGNIWIPQMKHHNIQKSFPHLPKFVISGSSTELSASQIKKLNEDIDFDNTYSISLSAEEVLDGHPHKLAERALENFGKDNIIIVHTSEIRFNSAELENLLLEKELTKKKFAVMIEDFLAELCSEVVRKKELILVVLGGETSFKCTRAIDSESLHLIDAVAPAIPLCIDHKAQLIVTKSGNLGTTNTLIEILKYFEAHEQ